MSDKSETFSSFDAADYLATFDDVAAYLEAVIEEWIHAGERSLRVGRGRDVGLAGFFAAV